MKVGILQLNFTVGDFEGNMKKIEVGYTDAVNNGAELVVTSELALFGYPPGDMLLIQEYLKRQMQSLSSLAASVDDVPLIIGVVLENTEAGGKPLFNCAVLIQQKSIVLTAHKRLLPNYDVFDERRYFKPSQRRAPKIFLYQGLRIGILICEDIWRGSEELKNLYEHDPVSDMAHVKPDLLITINASHYYLGKGKERYQLLKQIAKRIDCPVVYVNQVGGNDELIYDGRSFVIDNKGNCFACAPAFEETQIIVDLENSNRQEYEQGGGAEDLFKALVLGTRDYVRKCGFKQAVIGSSGGIDSALTACVAVEALGSENVLCVNMPSQFSSKESIIDARALAKNLKTEFEEISITGIYGSFRQVLKTPIDWFIPGKKEGDPTEENVQARIRGAILMAISNRTGRMLLTTGNKSELSVGYCTLYGDMAGGFAVISDVWKTHVYRLCRFINRERNVIPISILKRPPSAELKPGQLDSEYLPDYTILDQILKFYIEDGRNVFEIIGITQHDPEEVMRIIRMVNTNEFKRRQMPLGLKVSKKAFGSGRRVPLAVKHY